jgi:hypothetical protein
MTTRKTYEKTHHNPLHIECIQQALRGLDHPMVIGRHSVATFDLGSLVTVECKKQLHRESSESSESKQKCSKGRVLARLSMCAVPPALLALFKPSTRSQTVRIQARGYRGGKHIPCIYTYNVRHMWCGSLIVALDGERDERHHCSGRFKHLTNDRVSFSTPTK